MEIKFTATGILSYMGSKKRDIMQMYGLYTLGVYVVCL